MPAGREDPRGFANPCAKTHEVAHHQRRAHQVEGGVPEWQTAGVAAHARHVASGPSQHRLRHVEADDRARAGGLEQRQRYRPVPVPTSSAHVGSAATING